MSCDDLEGETDRAKKVAYFANGCEKENWFNATIQNPSNSHLTKEQLLDAFKAGFLRSIECGSEHTDNPESDRVDVDVRNSWSEGFNAARNSFRAG